MTVIVEASAPQGRAPSRRPHPCHPFVVLRCVPAPPRATSAARPRPPLSLPRLRGSGSRLGRAVSRGGAEPRARATAVGTAHALGRGPSRIRSARPWVIGAHGRDTVETRVRGRDADIGPYATAVPLVPIIMNKIMNQQEQMRSRDGRLPLTDSFSCCETRKSLEVDGKSLPLHGCCPAVSTLNLIFSRT